jgi:magnesium transporter
MLSLYIDRSGNTREVEVSRKDLTKDFKVHTRDMRPIFAKKQAITITSRGECIIINFHSVKMVVGKNGVYVFNLVNKKIVDYFLPLLLQKIKNPGEKIRFEHLIIEITLIYMVEKLSRRFDDVERGAEQIFHKLQSEKIDDHTFEKLLHLKKRLSKLATKVKDIENGIEELVEDDEELSDLYLGVKNPSDTEDAESILENALEQVEDVAHKIYELNENIDDTQEILTLKMSNVRNVIIRFDLLLTAATGILAILAVVVGFYGMNIPNQMEKNPEAIWGVAILLMALFVLGFGGLLLYLKKKKIL